jgi:hypothetical protein
MIWCLLCGDINLKRAIKRQPHRNALPALINGVKDLTIFLVIKPKTGSLGTIYAIAGRKADEKPSVTAKRRQSNFTTITPFFF